MSEIDKKRSELLKLPEDGDINQSVKYINKALSKIVEKLYKEVESRQLQKANESLTDMLISWFSSTLGGLDAIKSPEEMEKELQRDKLLKADDERMGSNITPYLLFLGLFNGGLTVGKHVSKHIDNNKVSSGSVEDQGKETAGDAENETKTE